MKTLKTAFAILLLTVCNAIAANNIYSVRLAFTLNPSDGDTFVINGATRTFRVGPVAAPDTEITIGATTVDTVANTLLQIQEHGLSQLTPHGDGTTDIVLVADVVNFVVTASMTGAWGSATATPTSINLVPVQLPLSLLMPLPHRTNVANWLVLGMRDYTRTNFPAGTPVLVHYMDDASAQVIAGAKTLTGATTLSNANNLVTGGALSNLLVRTLQMKYDNAHANGMRFLALGDVPVSTIAADIYGLPTLYDTGVSETPSTEFGPYAPSAGNLLTRGMADTRFARLASPNTFTGSNTFNALVYVTDLEGIITNAIGGFMNLWASNLFVRAKMAVSNAAPDITFHDTNGATDNKRVHLAGDDGSFTIWIERDDFGTVSTPFMIHRTGNTVDYVYLGGPGGLTEADGTFWVYGNTLLQGNSQTEGIVGIGSTNSLAPAGMSAGILQTNAISEPSADPAHAVADWAFGDEWKYRHPGSGTNHRVHNAAAISIGSGSDYNLTASYAQVTFGSSVSLSLPTAGTYRLSALVAIDEDGGNANDANNVKLYNVTDASDITGSERTESSIPAGKRRTVAMESIVSVASAKTIQLYGKNSTSARGSIASTQTSLSYIRLY